jgi:hypothetical protein
MKRREERRRRRSPAAGVVLSRREALVAELLASTRGGFPTVCDGKCARPPCGPDEPRGPENKES